MKYGTFFLKFKKEKLKMIYSKFGIVMMFVFSILGLYMGVKFINEYWMVPTIGFVLFIETTYIWMECVYSEMKYRKRNQKKDEPVKILHEIKLGRKLIK